MVTLPSHSPGDDFPQPAEVPIPIIIAVVVVAIGFIGIFVTILVLFRRRPQGVNVYTLRTYPAVTIVTVQPHPELLPAPLPTYEQYQATHGGAAQAPYRNEPSKINYKPDHVITR